MFLYKIIFNFQVIFFYFLPASGGWRRRAGETAFSEFPVSPEAASPSPPAVQAPPC